MRVHRPLPAVCLIGALALTGCQTAGEERPSVERPTFSEPLPEETPATVETPEGAPAMQFVDSSIGGAKEQDPLWQALEQAAAEGEEIYLRATLHNYQPPLEGEEQITVSSDLPDSVSITVDGEQVETFNEVFHRITGTFDVEEIGSAAYVLTTVDGEEIDALAPDTPSDEERCTEDRAEDRVNDAVYQLADDPDTREELRLRWAGSPGVWWAIQSTAATLADSGGEFATDALTEACGPYLEDAAAG